MRKGAIVSVSQNQKLDTKSIMEAELVGADDASSLVLWTNIFLEEKVCKVKTNILYQDNKITILLH